MYAIVAVGLLTIFLSVVMILNPDAWSRGILAFSQKPYFHCAEIASRLLLGGTLIFFADATLYPLIIKAVGGVFVFAGAILMLIGSKWHREFAVRSSTFKRIFRPAGFFSAAFGAFVIYAAVAA